MSLSDCEVILEPLKRIWLAANLPCSKRLKPILSLWLPGYEPPSGPCPEIKAALRSISPATIDRLLQPRRSAMAHRGRATTKPGTLLRSQIPRGPTSGMRRVRASWKRIRWRTAGRPCRACRL